MPKLVDFTLKTFSQALQLAEAVDYLGGNAKIKNAAEKMKLRVTGSFTRLIGASAKHQLVENSKGSLTTTQLYKNIKHAYTESERLKNLRISFLSVPVYEKIYTKFRGRELPIDMIDRILIREFDVEEHLAKKIANNFIEGGNLCGLMVDNRVMDFDPNEQESNEPLPRRSDEIQVDDIPQMIPTTATQINRSKSVNSKYTIHIVGEGINTELSLEDADDFAILNAVISKLKKKITKSKNENE